MHHVSKKVGRLARTGVALGVTTALLWVAATSVAAPRPAPLTPGTLKATLAKKKPVTITYFNYGTGGPAYIAATIKAFQKKYPWIKVRSVSVPFTNYIEQESKYISSRSGPDVMSNNAGWELLGRRTAYRPLNGVLKPYVKNLVRYSDGCLNYNIKHSCFGLPYNFQANVLYYNRAVLQQAGLNPDGSPEGWSELSDACERVKAIGKSCMAAGYGTVAAYWIFPEVARNFLTEKDIVSLFQGKLGWTDPRLKSTLGNIAQMANKGWFQPGAATTPFLPDAQDVFIRGDAAFIPGIVSSNSNWKFFGDKMGYDKVGVQQWPIIRPRAPLASKLSSAMGVNGVSAWSKNPNEAFLFVQWISSDANAKLILTLGGGQPPTTKYDKKLITVPQFKKIETFIAGGSTLHAGVALTGRVADAFSRGFQQIILKQITVDQWAEQMDRARLDSPEFQR